MAVYKSKGIVIGRHNFGEADRIIVFITPDKGVQRAVAKGIKRIKSRLAGHLELFCDSELMLAEGKNLDVITSARLQRHYSVTGDYDRLRLGYLVAEMINRLSGEDQQHDGSYELVGQTLAAIEEGPADTILELWFKLRLLDSLGYRPELDGCTVCGKSDPTLSYKLDVERGGIVNDSCAGMAGLSISNDQIKLWRLCLSNPIESVRRVNDAEVLTNGSLPLINAFYDHVFGKRFKSSEALA
jgi:DNA repair protein RecO (recombination protein O)